MATSTLINLCSKDLSNRPMYAVLNTHNLDMILQLKYMPIVHVSLSLTAFMYAHKQLRLCFYVLVRRYYVVIDIHL